MGGVPIFFAGGEGREVALQIGIFFFINSDKGFCDPNVINDFAVYACHGNKGDNGDEQWIQEIRSSVVNGDIDLPYDDGEYKYFGNGNEVALFLVLTEGMFVFL